VSVIPFFSPAMPPKAAGKPRTRSSPRKQAGGTAPGPTTSGQDAASTSLVDAVAALEVVSPVKAKSK
jgi:hypothetical protein